MNDNYSKAITTLVLEIGSSGRSMEVLKDDLILEALRLTNGNKSMAARLLGFNLRTIRLRTNRIRRINKS